MLKASVASRTLDNITGVLISFKNFRKGLKAEFNNGAQPGNTAFKGPDVYKASHLNAHLGFPNGDLTADDVERPESITKTDPLDLKPIASNAPLLNSCKLCSTDSFSEWTVTKRLSLNSKKTVTRSRNWRQLTLSCSCNH